MGCEDVIFSTRQSCRDLPVSMPWLIRPEGTGLSHRLGVLYLPALLDAYFPRLLIPDKKGMNKISVKPIIKKTLHSLLTTLHFFPMEHF